MTLSVSASGGRAQVKSHNECIEGKETPPQSTLAHAFQVRKQDNYEQLVSIIHGGFPGRHCRIILLLLLFDHDISEGFALFTYGHLGHIILLLKELLLFFKLNIKDFFDCTHKERRVVRISSG